MTTKRSAEIDSVRLFCNLLVVLLHASAAFQYVRHEGAEYWFWSFLCGGFAPVLLPTLFFLSGYLLFRNYSNAQYGRKIWSRVRRLAVPYLAWNVLFVVVYLAFAAVVPRLATRVAQFGLDTWSGCLDKIVSLTIHPIDGPLWFVRTLFVFALFAPVLDWVFRKVPAWGLAMLCVALVGATALFPAQAEALKMTYPAYAAIAFVTGGGMAARLFDAPAFFQRHRMVFLPISVAAMVGMFLAKAMVGTLPPVVTTALTVLTIPLLWTVAKPLTRLLTARWIQEWLAPSAFFVYAGHFLFASTLLHTVAPLLPRVTGVLTMLCLIFVLFGTAFCVLAHRVGRRIAPRLMRVFDGTL